MQKKGKTGKKTDVIGSWKGFAGVYLEENKKDGLRVVYSTGAHRKPQGVWIKKNLPESWAKNLADSYSLELKSCEVLYSEGTERYNVVVGLGLPGHVNLESIPDIELRVRTMNSAKKYFSECIRREYPLPFKTDYCDIPLAAGTEDYFRIANSAGNPFVKAFPDRHWKILIGEKFKKQFKSAVEAAGGELVELRPFDKRKDAFRQHFIEITVERHYEQTTAHGCEDQVFDAMYFLIKKTFRKRNYELSSLNKD